MAIFCHTGFCQKTVNEIIPNWFQFTLISKFKLYLKLSPAVESSVEDNVILTPTQVGQRLYAISRKKKTPWSTKESQFLKYATVGPL